mmetsp:Transcript_14077/g.46120  ORF Transcript_14077/g.46120 Transcript_14077/m.46120 type:complete len:200 (+) Transcript_14077:2953-3552(+)
MRCRRSAREMVAGKGCRVRAGTRRAARGKAGPREHPRVRATTPRRCVWGHQHADALPGCTRAALAGRPRVGADGELVQAPGAARRAHDDVHPSAHPSHPGLPLQGHVQPVRRHFSPAKHAGRLPGRRTRGATTAGDSDRPPVPVPYPLGGRPKRDAPPVPSFSRRAPQPSGCLRLADQRAPHPTGQLPPPVHAVHAHST